MQADDQVFMTKPRGVFRHHQQKPLVGDWVSVEWEENQAHDQALLVEIAKRKNTLIRPSVANVDHAFVVMSLVEPDFSYSLVDHFLVWLESHAIKASLILTKKDLLFEKMGQVQGQKEVESICNLYESIGYPVIVKEMNQELEQAITDSIDQGVHILMGQSGVGKSTLLNQLIPDLNLDTGEISDYLNRGRHTTREVSLYPLGQGWMADTPGFSSLEFPHIEKEDLGHYFPEMDALSPYCKYRGCHHLNEPGCVVKSGLDTGLILESRYKSYQVLYQKIENRKPIYRKKK